MRETITKTIDLIIVFVGVLESDGERLLRYTRPVLLSARWIQRSELEVLIGLDNNRR